MKLAKPYAVSFEEGGEWDCGKSMFGSEFIWSERIPQ
ncbi:hypothetical protein BVRB_6g152440 [Beta vulgaris subsp. vulgaris]|nr:hypothetical protein BVRB_6g152440 [Beta vulgaris subsp. vulgaris]